MSENNNNSDKAENTENTENTNPAVPGQTEIQASEPPKNRVEAFSKFKDSILGTAAILGMITFVTGFVLAAFNFLTVPVIEERLRREMEDSIAGFFGGGVEFEYIDFDGFDFDRSVAEAVCVREASSQKLAGYCVTVAPRGFSGDILMLVAVNANITVRDVKILDMSETAGIGTKIESESWFIEQFKFKSRNISAARSSGQAGGNAIDTVSGATKSSKAFLSGVNAALEAAHLMRNRTADAPKATETATETVTGEEEILDE